MTLPWVQICREVEFANALMSNRIDFSIQGHLKCIPSDTTSEETPVRREKITARFAVGTLHQ